MEAKDKREKIEIQHGNIWGFLVALMNFALNLLKLEKIACLVIVYLLIRDFAFVRKLGDSVDVSGMLIDAKIINTILSNSNTLIICIVAIAAVELIVILLLIFAVLPIYKKEIDRLSKMRSDLMHGEKQDKRLENHNTSVVV